MFRIVHLSDIHLDKSTIKDASTFVFEALEKDLIKYNKISPISIIVISGDLIDCGAASFENDLQVGLMTFEEVFIDRITKAINLSKNRVFLYLGTMTSQEIKITK